jgi:hypothetical protein
MHQRFGHSRKTKGQDSLSALIDCLSNEALPLDVFKVITRAQYRKTTIPKLGTERLRTIANRGFTSDTSSISPQCCSGITDKEPDSGFQSFVFSYSLA